MKKVYFYHSYREFLRDLFQDKKQREGYTYRHFSEALGVNSPSWLPQLVKGEKNLSPATALRVAEALGLKKREKDFFVNLVEFTQAKSVEKKDAAYKAMLGLKKKLRLKHLDETQYQLYSKWYFPVIRSLVSKLDFKEDYKFLGESVRPKISAGEARQAVKMLVKSGLIEKTKSGDYRQTQNMLTTGDEVNSLNVINYHKSINKVAMDAFDIIPKDERDISALTLGINKNDFPILKKEIQAFRKKLLDLAGHSSDPDSVYQINLQFFPVSRSQPGGRV